MGVLTASKILLVLTIPFLVFLASANLIAFDKAYYQSRMHEYGINVPEAGSLNEKTIDFVSGKNGELPNAYNEGEKQHLNDVRDVVKKLRLALYFFMLLLMSLLLTSAFILKFGNGLANFIGKALAYGGFLAIGLAAVLLILINFNFSSAFDSFHSIFFEKGTYAFDPANEIIVSLYPAQLYIDIGLRICKWVLIISAIITAA